MTNRERDILRIIEEDPFVSQNEIADKLDITRSAVSGYLNAMYKKGIIKGRGYIIREETYPVVIGPSHIDIRSVCNGEFASAAYISHKTQIYHGGPVKNTAEYLIGMGIVPRAIFAVASDDFGASFLDACKKTGIDASGSVIVNDVASPVYVEFVDKNRHFITSSFSTDNLSTHISPAHLEDQMVLLKGASTIIMHDSVLVESAEYLQFCRPNADLLMVSSDIDNTGLFDSKLHLFDSIVIAYYIAAGLDGISHGENEMSTVPHEDIFSVAQSLIRRGASEFYMLIDSTKLCHCDGKKLTIHASKNPAGQDEGGFRVYVDTRDVIAAVVTYCQENGHTPETTLEMIASARNVICASSSNFSRGINLTLLKDGEKHLDSEAQVFSMETRG